MGDGRNPELGKREMELGWRFFSAVRLAMPEGKKILDGNSYQYGRALEEALKSNGSLEEFKEVFRFGEDKIGRRVSLEMDGMLSAATRGCILGGPMYEPERIAYEFSLNVQGANKILRRPIEGIGLPSREGFEELGREFYRALMRLER